MTGATVFEVKTVYDQATLAAGQKVLEFRDPALKANIRNFRLILCGFGGVLFGLGGMALGGEMPLAVTVLLMVVGGLIVCMGIFYREMLSFGSRKAVTGETETVWFGEDGFALKSPSREREHPYEDLMGLYHRKHYLFLFVRLSSGYVVDERGLTAGDPQALRAFLEEKTGKQFVRVK